MRSVLYASNHRTWLGNARLSILVISVKVVTTFLFVTKQIVKVDKDGKKDTSNLVSGSNCDILLQTAKAGVVNPETFDRTECRILFDSGSQRSYIASEWCSKLMLSPIRKEKLLINTFGDMNAGIKEIDVVRVKLINKKEEDCGFFELLVVPLICSPLSCQRTKMAKSKYDHLKDLYLADFVGNAGSIQIQILIGTDYYFSLITGRCKRGEPDSPVALESRLGWILSGPVERCAGNNVASNHISITHSMLVEDSKHYGVENECAKNEVYQKFSRFWEVESAEGYKDIMDQFTRDIVFENSKYFISLPFNENRYLIPDNFKLCNRRLDVLRKRLLRDPELAKNYCNIFSQYEKDGIIEKVLDTDENPDYVHYLPHHPVIRNDKESTKLRPVFDASSHEKNELSLNDCLETGPNLILKIFDILVRFRFNEVVVLADIKQAFLNIGIRKEDTNYLRFLYYEDIFAEHPSVCVYRLLRVLFGAKPSPFLLNATIRHHSMRFVNHDRAFVEHFLRNLYIDDVVSGAKSVEEGFDLQKGERNDVKRWFYASKMGF